MENKETFQYTYSAKEQAEIKAIRKKYEAPEQTEDKMAQLRRLDAAVTQKATTVSLVFGILGALIMGAGMSLVMTDIGAMVGVPQPMIVGIVVGVIGLGLALLTYPIYKAILNRRRKKYADRILALSDSIMEE